MEFTTDSFIWKQTRWSSECKECHNRHRYWETCREKKRNEDLSAFLRTQANNAVNWRLNNPDKLKEYGDKRKHDPKERLKEYKRSAAKRGITFNEAEEAELLELFGKSCHYCGTIDTDRATGVDRINNDLGYSVENCVTCCTACNLSKGTSSVQQYIWKMCTIHKKGQAAGVVINEQAEFKFAGLKSNKDITNVKLGVELYPRHEGECYLCGYTGVVGTDRVDNTRPYEEIFGIVAASAITSNGI